jgi:hypothetical protein
MPNGVVLFAGHAFMPRLLVTEARAETAIDAPDDGLDFAALMDLARFATRAATPSEVWIGVESAPAALLVIAWGGLLAQTCTVLVWIGRTEQRSLDRRIFVHRHTLGVPDIRDSECRSTCYSQSSF